MPALAGTFLLMFCLNARPLSYQYPMKHQTRLSSIRQNQLNITCSLCGHQSTIDVLSAITVLGERVRVCDALERARCTVVQRAVKASSSVTSRSRTGQRMSQLSPQLPLLRCLNAASAIGRWQPKAGFQSGNRLAPCLRHEQWKVVVCV